MSTAAGVAAPQRGLAARGEALSSRSRLANRAAFRPAHTSQQQSRRGSLQVHNALSRQGKLDTVDKLVPLLESSAVVVGIRYQGLTVKQIQELRAKLPAASRLVVCKNTLLKVAVDKTQGWGELKQAAKGDNAWLFVPEDEISASVKAYLAFQASLKEALPKDERATAQIIEPSGGVMDGKFLSLADIKALEKLPTKAELMATVARLIKQVPTRVAVGIRQVPTKLVYGVKALADADDDKSLVVGDVCKPKPAEA